MANYKINLNFPLVDLSGRPLKESNDEVFTLSKVLATALARHNEGDAIKNMEWARKLYNSEDLLLDKSDFITLKEFVKNNKGLTSLEEGPILEAFMKSESEAEKTPASKSK